MDAPNKWIYFMATKGDQYTGERLNGWVQGLALEGP